MCVLVSACAAVPAASPETGGRVFSRESIERAVALSRSDAGQEAPEANWSRVEQLVPDTPISVAVDSGPSLRGTLVAADSTGLTVRDGDGRGVRIARPSVAEIREITRRRGSKLGAVIGAGAGGFLGFVTALNLALRDCGGDCRDERFLVGLSLVGAPVAGGVLGYFAGGARTNLIYRRS
jgi:hypothetical protein